MEGRCFFGAAKASGWVTVSEGDDHVSCFYYSFWLFGFLASRDRFKKSL